MKAYNLAAAQRVPENKQEEALTREKEPFME